MKIPIENIYYLLCYAWNKLEEKDRVAISAKDFTNLVDLLAKVLINGTKILLKRGIEKSYVSITSELAGIKGKIAFSETIKSNLLHKKRTICSYDEFSANVLLNQILLTTLRRLQSVTQLDKSLKGEIRSLIPMFPDINYIPLNNSVFQKVRLNRNNRFYGFILNVCEIIYQNSLPSENAGEINFIDFTRDENKMNQLFQNFIRNFYSLEQKKYPVVRGEIIEWKFNPLSKIKNDLNFLPKMHTDITLENEVEKIIIDAKYYQQTLAVNFGKEIIHSGNLYQLFSYLLNQENEEFRNNRTIGILLYPTIVNEYDLEFIYKEHPIKIKTLNLNMKWQHISERLLSIISAPKDQ